MGIFDKVFKVNEQRSSEIVFTKEQAFIGILLAATESDGHVAIQEIETVRTTLQRSKMFNHLTELQFRAMMNETTTILRRDGAGTIINAAGRVLPMPLKECVFAISVDLILSDGIINAKEKEFVDNLQRAIGINDAMAQNIAEVMLIRNRA